MQDIPFESENNTKIRRASSGELSLGSSITIIGFIVTIIGVSVAVYFYQKNANYGSASETIKPTIIKVQPLHPPFPPR